MNYSDKEQISHVARRLGFGIEPQILASATSVDDAINAALDLSTPTPEPTDLVAPVDFEDSRSQEQRQAPYRYWITQMVSGPRRIEERLTWFWHDHFATSIRKVQVPYLMYVQHLTLREHATGNFADLLYGVATDPAMLIYLDGFQNQVGAINENFGREVMELFTLGIGNYTEEDVLAASAAFSGWIVARGGGRAERLGATPWEATFVQRRHDDSTNTFLGVTGSHDAQDAVDILLEQPATAEFITSKLYRELVGPSPGEETTRRIAAAFRRDYSIMALVEAIVAEPAFTSDDAIRAKVRTPLERAVGLAQVYGYETEGQRGRGNNAIRMLESVGYAPFNPPDVAGYTKGTRLLGPYILVHGFDLSWMVSTSDAPSTTTDFMEGLGLFDLTDETRTVLDEAPDPATRAALAINAPEYLLV
ncbi:MAG: DUF1800 family protein [Acidimicrobiia bacterium]